jgi:hypothetical protein
MKGNKKPTGDKPITAPGPTAPPPTDPRRQVQQRAAHHADALRGAAFPVLMSEALGLGGMFDGSACRVFLERLLADAGNPADPVERMLLEQLALAHFRTAQLHVAAGQSKGAEAAKLLSAAAARLLGEFRRTALALRAYRGREPGERATPLKVFKAAQ